MRHALVVIATFATSAPASAPAQSVLPNDSQHYGEIADPSIWPISAVGVVTVAFFGYSNGGHMAFRLAMEAPDEIAAIASVAANLPTPDASSCPQQGRTSRVMLINGTSDPINPYQGGIVTLFGFASRGAVMSSVASAQHFAERNGITFPPISGQLPKDSSYDITSVETLTWHTNGKPYCCLCTVRGGGHVIPQQTYRFPRLLGKTTKLLDAPRESFRFFTG
jgi:polyhydroxybutyrate depolymerase